MININPADVRSAASKLKSCSEELRQEQRSFRNIGYEIADAWKSSYTNRYISCLEDTENDIMNAAAAVERIAGDLEQIARSVARIENDIQSKMLGH